MGQKVEDSFSPIGPPSSGRRNQGSLIYISYNYLYTPTGTINSKPICRPVC